MSTSKNYIIVDTFNGRVVSRHRSLAAAAKADRKYGAAVARANGRGSYIPTAIRRENTERARTSNAYETALPLTDAERAELERAYEVVS